MERQDPDLETTFAKHVSDKGLVMFKKKKKHFKFKKKKIIQ